MLATSLTAAVVGVGGPPRPRRGRHRLRLPQVHDARPARLLDQGERGAHPRRAAQLRLRVQVGPAHHGQHGARQPAQDGLLVRPGHRGRAAGRRRRRCPRRALARRPARRRAGPRRRRAAGQRRPAHDADGPPATGCAAAVVPAANAGRSRDRARAPASIRWRRCPRPWRSRRAETRPPPARARVEAHLSVRGASRPRRRPRAGPRRGARWRSPPPAATTCCFIGPPGSGKTMLARRLPGILPPLVRGRRRSRRPRSTRPGARGWTALLARAAVPQLRTTRSATPRSSAAARIPRPGEVSLAHNGVLFLDELPEFRRNVLEALRQPLEERRRHDRPRARHAAPARALPARGGHEPLPLRRARRPHRGLRLHADGRAAAIRAAISGPLLDRIDLQVEVRALSYAEIAGPPGEATSAVAPPRPGGRGQRSKPERQQPDSGRQRRPAAARLREVAALDAEGARSWRRAVDRLGPHRPRPRPAVCGSRAPSPTSKARTRVTAGHLAEALQFRRRTDAQRCGHNGGNSPSFWRVSVDSSWNRCASARGLCCWVGGRSRPLPCVVHRPTAGPIGGEMANEFYTLIVVPHAKARFRRLQVSVKLMKWVGGVVGCALAAVIGHPGPLRAHRRSKSTSCAGSAPRTSSSAPRPRNTSRTPASCRARSSTCRRW